MKNKTKSPEKATINEAFKYVANKQWSFDEFNDFVLNTYKTGYDYGVREYQAKELLDRFGVEKPHP